MKQHYSAFSSGAILLGALSWGTTALAATFTADISANLAPQDLQGGNPGSVYYSQENGEPPDPAARVFGGVFNSLGEGDGPSNDLDNTLVTETYGDTVTWGAGSAQGFVGNPSLAFGSGITCCLIWSNPTFSAALDLDVSSAPLGSSVAGYANAGVLGSTYDGSDSFGDNLKYTFNVNFSIDAIVSAGAG